MKACIEIIVPGETFRLTTFASETIIEGRSFTPARVVFSMNDLQELLVVVEAEHPLAKRWLAGTLPKGQTEFRLFQCYQIDEHKEVIHRWQGDLVDGVFDGSRVVFRVESFLAKALRRSLPSLIVSPSCQHRLFDSGCRLAEKDFTKIATITALNGYQMTLDIILEATWLHGGELFHIASGERIVIVDQAELGNPSRGSVITLQAKPYNARLGDMVEVLPGCDREIATCRDKFNNVVNFGGFPHFVDPNSSTD